MVAGTVPDPRIDGVRARKLANDTDPNIVATCATRRIHKPAARDIRMLGFCAERQS